MTDFIKLCTYFKKRAAALFNMSEEELNSLEVDESFIDRVFEKINEAQGAVEKESMEMESQLQELSDAYEEISTLYKVNKMLASNVDYERSLPELMDMVLNLIPSRMSVIALKTRGNDFKIVWRSGFERYSDAQLIENMKKHASRTLEEGKVYVEEIKSKLFNNLLCVPVKSGDEIFGSILLAGKKIGPIYTASDKNILLSISEQLGLKIKNHILVQDLIREKQEETQLEIARKIQRSLLPKKMPDVPTLSFSAINLPARSVGGDYYDFLDLGKGKIGCVIADVSGKGVPAALLMATVRGTIRNYMRKEPLEGGVHFERDLGISSRLINKALTQDFVQDRFVTMILSIFDTNTGIFSYVNAGHEPIFHYSSRKKKLKEYDSICPPFGIMEDIDLKLSSVKYDKDDVFVFFTDGVTEARHEKEEYGFNRLRSVVTRLASEDVKSILNGIINNVNLFVGDYPIHDDTTILVVKVV
ncbi:MAG: SpoIIE family protein phosphatase [Thermotogae bacterium]|nr:SpoIIE family protein phosphatase [Thermotogota bacterium]